MRTVITAENSSRPAGVGRVVEAEEGSGKGAWNEERGLIRYTRIHWRFSSAGSIRKSDEKAPAHAKPILEKHDQTRVFLRWRQWGEASPDEPAAHTKLVIHVALRDALLSAQTP
jgi:hypothetical protein